MFNSLFRFRLSGEPVGFSECMQRDSFDSYKEGRLLLRLQKFQFNTTEDHTDMIDKIKREKSESKLIFSYYYYYYSRNKCESNLYLLAGSKTNGKILCRTATS